jgi:hypothetical protein
VLGISTVAQLARHDAFRLYDRLCRRTGIRHDPCCIDVFMSAIDQARGGPPTPWWKFTETRKQILAGRGVARRYRGALATLASCPVGAPSTIGAWSIAPTSPNA